MAEDLDPKISRRYRELGADEPPRELDQAILAAAHRAADRPHAPLVAPAGRHRWYFAFGAAAILVLAVAITVQVERQPDPEALTPSTVSVPPDRADRFYSQAEKESKGQVEPSKPLADAGPPPVRERRKAAPQQTTPAVPPPPEVKPQAAEEARADRFEAQPQRAPKVELQTQSASQPAPQAENRERSMGFSGAGEPSAVAPQPARPAAAPPASAPQARSLDERAVLSSAAALPPERLLERIAELRKEGRHDEADKALAEFRQRYPGYRIPEEMLKKVERPK